jgi:hypothetical protein
VTQSGVTVSSGSPALIQVASALTSRVCLSWIKGLERGLPVKKGRQLFRGPSGSDLRYLEQTL